MKLMLTAITVALMGLVAQSASAQTVVGYNRFVVPANSDARLTVPFTQVAEGTFTVSGKEVDGIDVAGPVTPNYANTYYVRFTSGTASGLWMTITSNTTTRFVLDGTVAAARTTLLGLVNTGDTFRVYKHQTLASMFPKTMYGVSYTNGTTVYMYDNNISAMTTNKSSARSGSYTTSGGGRWAGSGVNDNTVLKPETLFLIRNSSATPLTETFFGIVPDFSVKMLVAANGDLVIGTGYPVPVALKNVGLNGSNRTVYFYDVSATGTNKSSSKSASYTLSGGGRWAGSGVNGDEPIQPSQAVTLRLPLTDAGSIVTIPRPY